MFCHLTVKAFPAFYCWSRSSKSADLNYPPLPFLYYSREITGYITSHLFIISTYVRSILIRTGTSVENNYRNALVIGALYRTGHTDLPWCNDKQIHLHINEFINLLYLQLSIIVCSRYLQLHITIGECSNAQFIIELLAPFILAALRHTNDILRFAFSTRT